MTTLRHTSIYLSKRIRAPIRLSKSLIHYNHCQLRPFSSASPTKLRTTEIIPSHFSTLRADPTRLWSDIQSTADSFGTGPRYGDSPTQTGLSRLALTDSDAQARKWFIDTTKDLGCKITVDSIGNIFAVRAGLNNHVPATFVGSHLDSQPLGGRFDGVLGVCAGVEMLRVLNENWIETEGPVGVVNWTNEEGARFPVSMMGSGVWAGARELDETYELKEVNASSDGGKKTVKEELERIGYLGEQDARLAQGGMKMAGHFELHIEQGPRLEKEGKKVGVVQGVQAYKWFEVTVKGRSCHTGATDYKYRADPLVLATTILSEGRRLSKKMGALASTGVIRAEPGSVNTVPERIVFSLDVRHPTDKGLEEFLTAYRAKVDEHVQSSRKRGSNLAVTVDMKQTFESAATHFNEVAIGCVEQSAEALTEDGDVPRMVSGAGHDSVNTARHCPTAMIFVPCKEGVSHHPEEWCEQEDCAIGTDVVIQSVLRFDQWRHKRGHFAG